MSLLRSGWMADARGCGVLLPLTQNGIPATETFAEYWLSDSWKQIMRWWGDDCRSLGKHLGYALMLSNFLVSERGPWQTKTWIYIYIYVFFLWVLLRAHLVGWETGQGGWVEIQGFRKNKFPKMLDSFTSLTLPRRCAGWIQSKSFFTYLTWGVSPQKSIIFPQQL